MPKKTGVDELAELLSEFKDNEMGSAEMAAFLRAMSKLRPDLFKGPEEEAAPKRSRKTSGANSNKKEEGKKEPATTPPVTTS